MIGLSINKNLKLKKGKENVTALAESGSYSRRYGRRRVLATQSIET